MAPPSPHLYNKMMQKTEVWEILCEKQSHIDFEITLRREEIHLILADPTQTLLTLVNDPTSTLYRTLIRDYQFKSNAAGRAIFKRRDEQTFSKVQEAVEMLSTFVESFTQLRLRYSQQRQQSMLAIQRQLNKFKPEIGFKKKIIHHEEKLKQVHLVCLKSKAQEILAIIRDCSHFVRENLLFPLNSYIQPTIQHSHYSIFITKMVELHREDLLSRLTLYLEEINEVGSLAIQHMTQGFAQLEEDNKRSNRDHARGIYGVNLTVMGKDYLLAKLYCVLEIYFSNLKYAVKTLKDLPQSSCSEIEQQYKNKGITTFFLNPYQLVILRPPVQIDQIAKDLQQRKWVISSEYYPNFDFSIISKQSKLFITRLNARNIEFTHLKIEEKQIQFISDVNAYNRIEKQCKEFLFDTLTVEEHIDLFDNEFEMNVFSEYYLPKVVTVFAQLLWGKDKAVLKTFKKDSVDVYNIIASTCHQMRKDFLQLPWSQPIHLPMVHLIEQTTTIQDFQSSRYVFKNEFFVSIQRMNSIYKQNLGIFLVNNLKNATQLYEFLRINNKREELVQTCSILEINAVNSKQFNSILYWKISQTGKLMPKLALQNCLRGVIQRKQGLKIVLPNDYEGFILDFLDQALQYILNNRTQLQLTELTLYIPRSLSPQKTRELHEKLNHILHHDFAFTRINSCYLSLSNMLRLSCWRFAQLTCKFQDESVQCSPLSSFIFHTQIKRKIKHKFALCLPKRKCNKEYLVYLYGMEIYEIKPEGVRQIKANSQVEKQVEKMAKIMSGYFKNQNYFVVPLHFQGQELPEPIIYVCDSSLEQPKNAGQLSKYEIDFTSNKIYSCNCTISYSFQTLPPSPHTILQTHPLYLPTLLPHLHP